MAKWLEETQHGTRRVWVCGAAKNRCCPRPGIVCYAYASLPCPVYSCFCWFDGLIASHLVPTWLRTARTHQHQHQHQHQQGHTIEDISEELLTDCAQLVKQNSIEGCKHAVSVVYTPWSNLKKTADMAPGQVSFHNRKLVCMPYARAVCHTHALCACLRACVRNMLLPP